MIYIKGGMQSASAESPVHTRDKTNHEYALTILHFQIFRTKTNNYHSNIHFLHHYNKKRGSLS